MATMKKLLMRAHLLNQGISAYSGLQKKVRHKNSIFSQGMQNHDVMAQCRYIRYAKHAAAKARGWGPSKSLILTARLLQTASRIMGLTVPGLCPVLTLGSLATGNTMAGMQSEFWFTIFPLAKFFGKISETNITRILKGKKYKSTSMSES